MQLIYETMTKVDSNRTLVAKVFQSSKGTFGQVKLSLDNKGITVCRKDIE
jgi:imidazole glycerol phosphate synthase subunit HisF